MSDPTRAPKIQTHPDTKIFRLAAYYGGVPGGTDGARWSYEVNTTRASERNGPAPRGWGRSGRRESQQTSRLPDRRARKEEDMMGGKQSSASGVETEGSNQELPPAGEYQTSSSAAGAAMERARVRAGGTQSQHGPRILLIVDDPALGDWLLEEFQHVGCAVALATNGQDGLALIRSGLVDVVLSEMGLPGLPGMDLLRELQGMTKMPKVILTTSRHSDFLTERAIQNGASAVLRKPFRMEQLLASITRALGN